MDPCQRQLASISHDSSLRVWNLDSLTQTYEVFSAGEVPTTLAYHPYKGQFSLLLVSLFSATFSHSVDWSEFYCPARLLIQALITIVLSFPYHTISCAGIWRGMLLFVQYGVGVVSFFAFGFRSTNTFKLTLN